MGIRARAGARAGAEAEAGAEARSRVVVVVVIVAILRFYGGSPLGFHSYPGLHAPVLDPQLPGSYWPDVSGSALPFPTISLVSEIIEGIGRG